MSHMSSTTTRRFCDSSNCDSDWPHSRTATPTPMRWATCSTSPSRTSQRRRRYRPQSSIRTSSPRARSRSRSSRPAGSNAYVVRLCVELRIPLPKLHDRAVGVGGRGRRQERLVLPDRPVLLDLLVDLFDERVRDGGGHLRVVEFPNDEIETHDGRFVVDRRGGR